MKFSDYQAGRDQFGRKYPLKIVFKEGITVYGHTITYLESGENTTNITFKLIGNIDNWCKNIDEENREIMKFDDDTIAQISIFTEY